MVLNNSTISNSTYFVTLNRDKGLLSHSQTDMCLNSTLPKDSLGAKVSLFPDRVLGMAISMLKLSYPESQLGAVIGMAYIGR